MRLADIIVGEDYAIRWGGGLQHGRVTYAGTERAYSVHQDYRTYTQTGARVFFQVVMSDGSGVRETELDVPPGNVKHPWSHQEQLQAEADNAGAMHGARLAAVEAAVMEASGRFDADVRWDYVPGLGRYSTATVVVNIDVLAAALGVTLPPGPPGPE